jgi:hypothetical protein
MPLASRFAEGMMMSRTIGVIQARMQSTRLAGKSLEQLLAGNLAAVPESIRTAVRNNGGGHLNHSMFWSIMGPNAQAPRQFTLSNVKSRQVNCMLGFFFIECQIIYLSASHQEFPRRHLYQTKFFVSAKFTPRPCGSRVSVTPMTEMTD